MWSGCKCLLITLTVVALIITNQPSAPTGANTLGWPVDQRFLKFECAQGFLGEPVKNAGSDSVGLRPGISAGEGTAAPRLGTTHLSCKCARE